MNDELLRIIELFDEDEVTTADKIDRPQQALDRDAFDDFNKRNKLAGGGMLVQPGFGGTRQGYASDFVNINDIKKYNKNLLNKSIIISETVKAGANQAERVTLQNIFDVVDRTKDGDILIKDFKKKPNAETLQKLKKRRKNRLSFEREQALPPEEKAELRKKQKIAEQKWRNSKKGINYYNNYLSMGGIFPARTPEERIWRDIYRASKQKKGESRFIIKYPKSANVDKVSGLPETVISKQGNEYIPWDRFYKNITFYDTVSKKNIRFNTVKKWMTDNVENGSKKYDSALKNYKASNVINTFEIDGVALSKLAKDKQKGDFAKRITTAAAVNHRSGLNNFWDTEVTTASGNKMLNDKVQANISAYKNASNPNIEKKLLNIMKLNAKKIEGGGTVVLDDKTVIGKNPTIRSVVSALEKEFGVKIPAKKIINQIAVLGGGDCGRGLNNQGGRIGLQDGTSNVDVCFRKAIERVRKGGVDFTKAESVNFNNLTKSLRAVGASNIMKFGILPEVLLEGALIADKMASEGDSFAQGLRNSYLAIPFQAMGVAKTYEEGEKDRILAAAPESQRGKVLDVFNMQDELNKKFELMGASEGFKKQIAATDAVSDGPFGYVGDSQDLQKRFSDTRADLQDLSRGDINRAEKMLTSSPLDLNIQDQLTMDAYKSAIEKADADKAGNILVAPGTGFGVDAQIRKRMKELPVTPELAKQELKKTGERFGIGYTPFGMNELFTSMGGEDPRFGYDETGKYSEEKGLNDFINYLRNQQVADAGGVANLAGGGIAKEAGDSSGPPPESGPNSQGLPGLLKRVRNL